MMVDHILYSVPKRYIDGKLVIKLSDVYTEYTKEVYTYAKEHQGIGIKGEFDKGTYISNKLFCEFIEVCT
jgi:hypothetical protein